MKVLFVCSRNRRRSLTAEEVFRGRAGVEVRSAGTQPGARIVVSAGLLGWADVVVAMEKSHLNRLRVRFGELLEEKRVVALHIRDQYEYMQEQLVDELRAKVEPMLVELLRENRER